VAIVTGAGGMRNVGHSTALRLARDGADVVVSDVHRPAERIGDDEREAGFEGIHSVAGEIEAMGRRALPVVCDVTEPAQVQSMIEQTLSIFGQIDILVNTARAFMGGGDTSILETEEDHWDWVMKVNLRGAMTCLKQAAREMVKSGRGGNIVNISSLAGKRASPWGAAYSSSKAGLNMMTKVAALELAPRDIRVNAVVPGLIDTNRVNVVEKAKAAAEGLSYAEYRRRFIAERSKGVPLQRAGTPEDMANAVAYLVSDDASYVTGQCINVCGGMYFD
jgi:3-oxoacyl-[acyl-carrier protein] reductase/meso-butanediol dehydrogenase/(S,S)-butanediol dehydrogenase/diacetyl reductase